MKKKTYHLEIDKEFWSDTELEVEEEMNEFEEIEEKNTSAGKVSILKLFTTLIFLVLFLRLFQLQVLGAEKYHQEAQANYIRYYPLEPLRGLIYDRDNNLLVENVPSFRLILAPPFYSYKNKKNLLSKLRKLEIEDLEERLNTLEIYSNEPFILKNNLTYEEFLEYSKKIQNLPGVIINTSARRHYLFPELTSHILGYTGKINKKEYQIKKKEGYLLNDTIGKEGIEAFYEEELRGKNGFQLIEVDSLGKEIKTISSKEPEKGDDLVLTLNLDLQRVAYQALKKAVEERGSFRGVFIALDPRNGEVLSLVSLPSFNNEAFAQGISQREYNQLKEDKLKPLFNRAISGVYPPGSTLKPLIGIASLEEKILKPFQLLDCRKDLVYYGFGGSRWVFGGLKAYGMIDIQRALAISCNTFFYVLGGGHPDYPIKEGLGIKKIKKYAQEFGLGDLLGIDLPGEAKGLIPDPLWKEKVKGEKWYIGDTYHISIGQGDLQVTPLALVSYISTLANGGTLYAPHFLKTLNNNQEGERKEQKGKIIRKNFVSSSNLALIKKGMRKVVTEGSGRKLATLPVAVAGKTGTAECPSCKKDKTHAWFVGFAPYEDPEIAFVVLIENGGKGHETAVPVAKEILEWYFQKYKD